MLFRALNSKFCYFFIIICDFDTIFTKKMKKICKKAFSNTKKSVKIINVKMGAALKKKRGDAADADQVQKDFPDYEAGHRDPAHFRCSHNNGKHFEKHNGSPLR